MHSKTSTESWKQAQACGELQVSSRISRNGKTIAP